MAAYKLHARPTNQSLPSPPTKYYSLGPAWMGLGRSLRFPNSSPPTRITSHPSPGWAQGSQKLCCPNIQSQKTCAWVKTPKMKTNREPTTPNGRKTFPPTSRHPAASFVFLIIPWTQKPCLATFRSRYYLHTQIHIHTHTQRAKGDLVAGTTTGMGRTIGWMMTTTNQYFSKHPQLILLDSEMPMDQLQHFISRRSTLRTR